MSKPIYLIPRLDSDDDTCLEIADNLVKQLLRCRRGYGYVIAATREIDDFIEAYLSARE